MSNDITITFSEKNVVNAYAEILDWLKMVNVTDITMSKTTDGNGETAWDVIIEATKH